MGKKLESRGLRVDLTLNSYRIKSPVSQYRKSVTTAWAAIDCGSRRRRQAACVSRAVENRMLSCSSAGSPFPKLLLSSCSAVASALERWDIVFESDVAVVR